MLVSMAEKLPNSLAHRGIFRTICSCDLHGKTVRCCSAYFLEGLAVKSQISCPLWPWHEAHSGT